MKRLILAALASILGPALSMAQATVIGFDDVTIDTGTDSITPIPAGYDSLDWNNLYTASSDAYPGTGYAAGVTSSDYAAFNGYGAPAIITASAPFSLISGNFTAAYDTSDSLEVDGYLNGNEVYTTTFNIGDAGPTTETLNFDGVDTVVFTNADSTESFVADDLAVSVPEPASLGLVGLATMAFLRRRRQTLPALPPDPIEA